MRSTLAAAVLCVAVSASAGTITSLNHPTIPMRSGEYFMTATGTDLGTQFVYDGPTGRRAIDVTASDGYGSSATAWIPLEIVNTPGTYSLTVTGRNGDSGPATFLVTKPGRSLLSLHVPELLAAHALTRAGVGIRYEVAVTGAEGIAEISCDPVSGSTFPFGSSWIKCLATDQGGQRATAEIQVSVTDIAGPIVSVPKSFELPSEDERGAWAFFDVSAFDEIDGYLKPDCSPASGSFIPNGRTTIRCIAEDASLNITQSSFEVMVRPRDIGTLQLAVPQDMVVYSAHDKEGTIAEYKVEAYGSADPDPTVECTPASGEHFLTGETKVVCMAVDDFDQRAEAAFLVTVKYGDGLRLDDVSAEATSPEGASVTFEFEATAAAEAMKCSHESGAMFSLGATTVHCERGKLKGSFQVTVADTIAPHIARIRSLLEAVDADQRIPVQLEVAVYDAADAMPRCSVAGIHGGDGRLTSDLRVSLRPAVDASSEFRLQVSCVDQSGNVSSESVPIHLGPTARRRVLNR